MSKAIQPTYIETPRRSISGQEPYVRTSLPEVNKGNIEAVLRGNISLRVQEALAQLEAITPSERLSTATHIARQQTNRLRGIANLSAIPEDQMTVLYLEDAKYVSLYKAVAGQQEGDVTSYGFSMDLGTQEIVRTSNFPDYVLGSFAFHELIHSNLEQKVRVFHAEKQEGSDEQAVYYEPRRAGLEVASESFDDNPDTPKQWKSSLLNELGNYIYQSEYLREMVTMGNPIFKEEFAARDEHLKNFFSNPEHNYVFMNVTTPEGKNQRIILEKNKLHFGTDGKPLFEQHFNTFAFMQLADDLTGLCGRIGGEPFEEVLLKAKTDPRLQSKLRTAVDAQLGNGFFSRLKNASYQNGDFIEILAQVQNKRYTITE